MFSVMHDGCILYIIVIVLLFICSVIYQSDKINEIDNRKSGSVPTLCSSASYNRVLFSFIGGVGVTLHHWDIVSVNWDGSVVKSWWCNWLRTACQSISQPASQTVVQCRPLYIVQRSLVVSSFEKCPQLELLL